MFLADSITIENEFLILSPPFSHAFLEKKPPRFKELFPEYEKYQTVGAMGALVVKDDVVRNAEKAGLYVLTQTDEGGAALMNREGFEPGTFN